MIRNYRINVDNEAMEYKINMKQLMLHHKTRRLCKHQNKEHKSRKTQSSRREYESRCSGNVPATHVAPNEPPGPNGGVTCVCLYLTILIFI